MGKPDPQENISAAPASAEPVRAAPGGAEPFVIHAEPGKPWPEPPTGGCWARNPKTGDLSLVEPPAGEIDPQERRARREAALQQVQSKE